MVDQKIVFEIDLNYIKCTKPEQQNIHQIDINSSFDLERLEAIALQCGEYSRFYTDKNFGYELYTRLYKEWLYKSIKKHIADQVFIYEENDLLTGFISISKKDKEGSIGLLAVDKISRGKSIGKKMVYTVFDYFKKENIMKVNVATQLNNINGCNFYKNIGFTQTSVTNIYHYWFK
jgi:dTDP-4-amino-4,6-dideoxy-D-galactose acyltransferase